MALVRSWSSACQISGSPIFLFLCDRTIEAASHSERLQDNVIHEIFEGPLEKSSDNHLYDSIATTRVRERSSWEVDQMDLCIICWILSLQSLLNRRDSSNISAKTANRQTRSV